MNIIFLSIGKLNNIEDKGIYTDLLREFRDHGHKVYVVSPREKRLNLPTEYVYENGVHFLRVRIGNITKTNLIEKGLSTIRIQSLFLKEIKKKFAKIKFELIIYSTPPITFAKVIKYIRNRDKAKSYLLLKDIFPQNAIDLKMLTKINPIYWYFRHKERKLYKNSDYIGCMSLANVKYILNHNHYVSKNVVEVCPNSIEPQNIEVSTIDRHKVRNKYKIPLNKLVYIYGGNLGKPQGIDFLIECIKKNEDNDSSYIVIVGSGTEYNKLKSFFDNFKPNNSKLLHQLPKNDYEELVNSADVGLIFLDHRFTIPNFPSRLLSYMQASIPVLAATDSNTDLGKIIVNGNFGYWCESNNVEVFNELLLKFKDDDLRISMGKNARHYLLQNYTSKHSYDIITKHFINDEKRNENV